MIKDMDLTVICKSADIGSRDDRNKEVIHECIGMESSLAVPEWNKLRSKAAYFF